MGVSREGFDFGKEWSDSFGVLAFCDVAVDCGPYTALSFDRKRTQIGGKEHGME
jgi:hypothetical protein